MIKKNYNPEEFISRLCQVDVLHSQGTTVSLEWQTFLKQHNMEASMSRRGNCYDNAVAESFFSSLKRERIRRRIYKTR